MSGNDHAYPLLEGRWRHRPNWIPFCDVVIRELYERVVDGSIRLHPSFIPSLRHYDPNAIVSPRECSDEYLLTADIWQQVDWHKPVYMVREAVEHRLEQDGVSPKPSWPELTFWLECRGYTRGLSFQLQHNTPALYTNQAKQIFLARRAPATDQLLRLAERARFIIEKQVWEQISVWSDDRGLLGPEASADEIHRTRFDAYKSMSDKYQPEWLDSEMSRLVEEINPH